jgi:CHAT domain-containing protein/tetratricopeptide (TPR) repeat protein
MQFALLLLACALAPQSEKKSPAADDSLARKIAVALRDEDPVLSGHGPSRTIEHTVESAGTLYLWTSAKELDGFLRIADSSGKTIAEDDNSGGGTTPFVALNVEAGQKLVVTVASAIPKHEGECELHIVASPDTDATLKSAAAAARALEKIRELRAEKKFAEARALLTSAIHDALAVDGSRTSARTEHAVAALGAEAKELSELRAGREAWSHCSGYRERCLPPDHPDVQAAREMLADALRSLGDVPAARSLYDRVLAARERTLPPEHTDLQRARLGIALTLYTRGDFRGAREIEESALEILSRALPADHLEIQHARQALAATAYMLGDLVTARALEEKALEALLRTLPEDHYEVQKARLNLGGTLLELGELSRGREVVQRALDVDTRTLPEDHPSLQAARQLLANVLQNLGDLHGAVALDEQAVDALSHTLPPDHADLLTARSNLASLLLELGDFYRAREIEESVLDALLRTLPPDHPETQVVRLNLANTLLLLGDLHGAREQCERALEALTRVLPADHPDLQSARMTLSNVLYMLGDLSAARELQKDVLEISSRTLPDDHRDLQITRTNLATTLYRLGDYSRARELQQKVLDVDSRKLPPDDPKLYGSEANLAHTLYAMGELKAACALQEKVLDSCTRTLPEDDRDLDMARENLMRMYAGLGDARRASDLAVQFAAGLASAIKSSFGRLSPRELEERVQSDRDGLSHFLTLARGAGVFPESAELDRAAFARVEASRSVALICAAVAARHFKDEGLARLGEQETKQTGELARLAQSGASREEITRARSEIDRLRRERMALLAADPATRPLLEDPTADSLGARLETSDAIVAYWRYAYWTIDPSDRQQVNQGEEMLAFVVRKDGRLTRVELGPIAAIHDAVELWREALRVPDERGFGLKSSVDPARIRGEALRKLVFDPLLPALEGVHRLYVALDDDLHAVPMDALPLGDTLLGETYAIEPHLSLRELAWPKRGAAHGALVAIGGARYNSPPETWKDPEPPPGKESTTAKPDGSAETKSDPIAKATTGVRALDADNASNPSNAGTSSQAPGTAAPSALPSPPAQFAGTPWERGFVPLSSSADEARGIAALFEEANDAGSRAIVLEKRLASRASLELLAPRARYLHIATHGWFAPDSIPSSADLRSIDPRLAFVTASSREEQVRGTSPMLLCGLALAGANLGMDALGRLPGILTAEEVASFDLSSCELAVLSACDTNVGVRRAGQGVASFQKALHMAGARTVLTSLWKVPDEATTELMLDFYRRIWIEKKPKARALWEAKMALRAKKDASGSLLYTTRDWAAWVLTGDPN